MTNLVETALRKAAENAALRPDVPIFPASAPEVAAAIAETLPAPFALESLWPQLARYTIAIGGSVLVGRGLVTAAGWEIIAGAALTHRQHLACPAEGRVMADLPPEIYFGFKPAHLLAGGVCRALASPGISVWRHIATAIVGTAVAAYGTPVCAPIVAHYLSSHAIPMGSIEGPTGFVLGLCGMSLCDAALRWVRIWRDGPIPKLPPAG